MCILAVLRRGESYGYDIIQKLAGLGGLSTGEGTIYPLLNRLKLEGDVETYWRESPAGPPRKYYALTPSGMATLSAMEQEWDALVRSIERLRGGRAE